MELAFFNFYRPIFGQKTAHKVQLDWQASYPNKDLGAKDLEEPFNKLSSMASDKASGVDGFLAMFSSRILGYPKRRY